MLGNRVRMECSFRYSKDQIVSPGGVGFQPDRLGAEAESHAETDSFSLPSSRDLPEEIVLFIFQQSVRYES